MAMLGFRYKDIYLFLFNANFLPIFFVIMLFQFITAATGMAGLGGGLEGGGG